MKDFEIQIPTKIIFGRKKEENVGKIIKDYGFKKIMVHYGQQSVVKSGLLNRVANSLTAAGIEYVFLGGVEANPKLSFVETGIHLARKEKVELILAVGGGSVIDSAKAIAVGYYYEGNPFDFNLGLATPKNALAVGVILTIAAAGSEMSSSCVISDEKTKLKRGFNSPLNRPLFSILNPELTFTVSPYQTACGIVDIMMHTLERYFNHSEEGELSDDLALAILRNVMESGRKAIKNPHDYEARAQLMSAGSWSHNGLTGLGKNNYMPVHQLEHIISGQFDEVAHGAGLAVLFPAWAEVFYQDDIAKFARFGTDVLKTNFNSLGENAKMGIVLLKKYFAEIGMPLSLSELGIKNPDIKYFARELTVNGSYAPISMNRTIDIATAEQIFRLCI